MKHLNITVFGKVQGVFFRAATKAVANQLKVTGFVKNLPDGSVYIEAEGDAFGLENFLEWCHEGPEHAVVEKVEINSGELKNYNNFEILKR
ncbi:MULTISPECIES: acylphosphatase [Olivibacter]|uniref:Acylphosphatase n=1 Tax=Olivibacter jilunii TaxID=985016 RepID=A0ABW6AZH9_9SPHI|nr:acylphosphatase [Olivibacter sp. 47]MCL4641277.1 acylphosphatase [Olivibacter sp. UJ_SKK_5.1]MDM8177291.1 acylphosphatase [Olivibacter sp. 47]MDX3911999.1 acylphosphatase [Pseudosphingobacterium sp.]